MTEGTNLALMTRYRALMISWPVVLIQAAATLAAVMATFLLFGALLFSGRPEPVPPFLYAGLVLVGLTIPMAIAVVLRLTARGRGYLLVVQSALALANLLFWLPLLVILIPQIFS